MSPVPFASEEIEPLAGKIISVASSHYLGLKEYERIHGVKSDRADMHDALLAMWKAVQGLEKIASALRVGRDSSDHSGVHFNMAASNWVSKVTLIVMTELGINPISEWK